MVRKSLFAFGILLGVLVFVVDGTAVTAEACGGCGGCRSRCGSGCYSGCYGYTTTYYAAPVYSSCGGCNTCGGASYYAAPTTGCSTCATGYAVPYYAYSVPAPVMYAAPTYSFRYGYTVPVVSYPATTV